MDPVVAGSNPVIHPALTGHAHACPCLYKYNPDIHNRQSIRFSGYDYSIPGAYFITICTHNRELLFGDIRNGKMELNEFGRIARDEWTKTGDIRPNIKLDEFVIMPNHVHGIFIIDDINDVRVGTDGGGERNKTTNTLQTM